MAIPDASAPLKQALDECLTDPEVKLYLDLKLVKKAQVEKVVLGGPTRKKVMSETGYVSLVNDDKKQTEARATTMAQLRLGAGNPYAVIWLVALLIIAVSILVLSRLDQNQNSTPYQVITGFGIISIFWGAWEIGEFIWVDGLRTFYRLVRIVGLVVIVPTATFVVGRAAQWISTFPASLTGIWIGVLTATFLGVRPETITHGRHIVRGGRLPWDRLIDWDTRRSGWKHWQSGLREHLLPVVRQVITAQLNAKVDYLLVEHESTGLRMARDPKYLVSTSAEERVRRRLKQINGGTVALAGQRGAGKSTVLTRIVRSGGQETADPRQVSVIIPAPTEYDPQEFLGNLFQQVCEDYLRAVHYKDHDTTLTHVVTARDRRRQKFATFRWMIRSVALLAIVVLGVVSLSRLLDSTITFDEIQGNTADLFASAWAVTAPDNLTARYWTLIIIACAVFMLVRKWRRPRRVPDLADRASQYLYRLRLNQTLTRGRTTTLPVAKSGLSVGMTRSRSLSNIPFTFPELVDHLREFLRNVAASETKSGRHLMVGIDEVDRIGTADQVEQFVRDVKAIFDIENCFFIITVADDVGALFAQRTLAGSNVFDSAFDDVIEIEPLRLDEARILLQRRAAGITDRFVWLLFTLSGGFPRELLRLARRLVDLNQEAYKQRGIDKRRTARTLAKEAPKVHELATALVRDETVQIVRSVRRRMGTFGTNGRWSGAIERMRPLVHQLIVGGAMFEASAARELRTLAAWLLSRSPQANMNGTVPSDADQVMAQLGTYLYFAATILDAFSGPTFANVDAQIPTGDGCGSFEYLAAARREVGVSPESSRHMLSQFRFTWALTDAQ